MIASSDRRRAGIPVLAPAGELDIMAVPQLRNQLRAACSPGATVVVDLHDVTFMDSSALAVLLVGERRLRATGGELQLVNVAEAVLKVLRICGLADRLVPPDTDASVAHQWARLVHQLR